ncbi:DNA polymerase III subunit gamma/tau [Nitrospira sp.]|nr:DNA polymerase III subunit gamma/tau [Nitrospira sp.]
MDYQVSARKYRPGTFDDVIGQPQVVQALTNAVSTKRIAHAFLFSGTRGVGKTTVARILAKALNCEQGPSGHPCGICMSCLEIAQGTSVDVVEIDGASNTSVDDVREIRENAKFTPFRGSHRVYIIDEVHMLSNSAFNALLKILEEPPAHVVFIFATTELHKIPATILSRCQHYTFRRLSRGEIIARLEQVAAHDGIHIESRSLAVLARASEGSMRDGLSLFDQAVALCGATISHEDLEALLGAVPQEHVHAMIEAIRGQDSRQAVHVIAQLLDHGQDLRAYCAELVEYVRNLLVATVVAEPHDLRGLVEGSLEDLEQLFALARSFSPEHLQEVFRLLSQAEDNLRQSLHPRFTMEVSAIRATRLTHSERMPAKPVAPAQPPAKVQVPVSNNPVRRGSSAPASSPPPRSLPPKPASARSARTGPVGASTTPAQGHASTMRHNVASVGRASSQAHAAVEPSALRSPTVQSDPGSPPAGSTLDVTLRPSPITINWEECLARVAEAHPSVAPFLEMGQCTGIDGNEVTIGYTPTASVARARMEKEDNLQAVRSVCESLAGQPVRVRVIELSEADATGPTMADIRVAREREEKMVLFEQMRAHPLIKQTLEAFGGEVVEVRRVVPEQEAQSA